MRFSLNPCSKSCLRPALPVAIRACQQTTIAVSVDRNVDESLGTPDYTQNSGDKMIREEHASLFEMLLRLQKPSAQLMN
jgi:hypothetical protein